MKYVFTMKCGKYRVGDIVDDADLFVRRKLQEGGCLKPLEEKQEKTVYENKAEKKENK